MVEGNKATGDVEQITFKMEVEMKLHEAAKNAGFHNLNELVFYSATNRNTLTNWFKNNPDRFDAILKGAVMRKVEALKNGQGQTDRN